MAYRPLVPLTDEFNYVKKVGVIGAGVAGLQMARACKSKGLEVTLFDKAPKVGGLWRENYSSYGLQVPKEFYEFPDFPFTEIQQPIQGSDPWQTYPTGSETQRYIEAYAAKYQLAGCVKLETEVKELKRKGKGWIFVVQPKGGGLQEFEFDFAIVCSGMYSCSNMPTYEGADSWDGKIIHASQYTHQDMARGKKVVVVGSGKSAIDITVDTSKVAASPPTMVFRKAHWSTPRYIAGIIPFQFIFLSRFGQSLVSWYKGGYPSGAPCYVICFSWILFPIMWVAFRVVEILFAIQRGHFGSYYPGCGFCGNRTDVVADFYGYANVLDTNFMTSWYTGKLKGVKSEVKKLSSKGVELSNGQVIEADLIVCATGFKKTYDYLPANVRANLDIQSDGLYLYRHFIPPAVRELGLAFCGSEIGTISNIGTHYIHAEYMARVLTGMLVLPSEADMKDELEKIKAWNRSWMPETGSRANQVLLHQIHYHDQLMRDMGENPNRMCWCLSEIFCPYVPAAYSGLMQDDKVVAGP